MTIITVAPQVTGGRVTHCTRFGQVHTEIYYSKTVDTLALIGTTHPFHMLGSSPDLDTVLTSLGQTKAEAGLMIMSFAARHHITGTALGNLLEMINTMFGQEVEPQTKYMFNKIFKDS